MILPKFSKPIIYYKNWGKEIWIHNSEKYCGKILEINKGCYSSLHFHLKKTETWYVLSGELLMDYYDLKSAEKKQMMLSEGIVVDIDPGVVHKLTALADSRIIEVSTQHFEDDSYRIQKSIEKRI
jgi:mannose-6-phosphate isomerase-like protein (cupin superfamily)